MHMRLKSLLLLTSLLPCATAQSGISVPATGYAYDSQLRAIRAVRGIPGAALVAEALDAGFDLAAAAIAPSQNFALAISTAGESPVHVISWRTGTPSIAILPDAMSAPDGFVFSPSGSAAVLSDSQSGQIQVATFLPDSPIIREIQPAGSPPARVIAVADDGSTVLVRADTVRLIGTDLNSMPLALPSDVTALAFSGSTHDLLAVTQAGDLYVAQNLHLGTNIRKVYSGDDRTADPVAVQFSSDGSIAFVANKQGLLASINLNAGTASAASCQCVPTALQPFGSASLFRLNGISNRPLLLFDATPGQARFWFVPAPERRNAQ
jgi:hypothetical protein